MVNKAKKSKAKGCEHFSVVITWHHVTGDEFSRRCSPTLGCGAQLDLSYSYEQPTTVEIRAAALAAGARSRKAERLGRSSHGFDCRGMGGSLRRLKPKDVDDVDAGWLCCELQSHDDREDRDARAWTWDITRPIAGQYEEWLVNERTRELAESINVEAAADFIFDPAPLLMNAQEVQEARLAEQTRHDVAASVARHAALPEPPDEGPVDLVAARGEDVPPAHGEGGSQILYGEDDPQVPYGANDAQVPDDADEEEEDAPPTESKEDAVQTVPEHASGDLDEAAAECEQIGEEGAR